MNEKMNPISQWQIILLQFKWMIFHSILTLSWYCSLCFRLNPSQPKFSIPTSSISQLSRRWPHLILSKHKCHIYSFTCPWTDWFSTFKLCKVSFPLLTPLTRISSYRCIDISEWDCFAALSTKKTSAIHAGHMKLKLMTHPNGLLMLER